ncbi:MAG: hypothetical protein KA369_02530 [Spirochaetes bacterium]|nr:hypothetical protein [Spirochaetota bacterium]
MGDLLHDLLHGRNIAYSPIMDCSSTSDQIQMTLCLQSLSNKISIHVSFHNFSTDEQKIFQHKTADMIHDITTTFNVICKKHVTITLVRNLQQTIYTSHLKEISISFSVFGEDREIHIFFPIEFFSFFSISKSSAVSALDIEKSVIRFFGNPLWMLPEIHYLFRSLDRIELRSLIHYLQKSGSFTPYQIFLVINAFPDLTGKIKNTLSQNSIDDVILFNKDNNLKITKRDIAGGVYSVEESISMLMRDGIDLSYSAVLRNIQRVVQLSLASDLALKKNFPAWLSEMRSEDLLQATISSTEEPIIAAAIGRDIGSIQPILSEVITQRKLDDIQKLLHPSLSYDDIMKGRIAFISQYRKLKMNRIKLHSERFAYLLSSLTSPTDYQYLLLSVGWFTLSTAMKGIQKKIVSSVLRHLPFSAGILIEDVLKGVVNPNILHDEMQINKARMVCVDSIVRLYFDALINIE